MADLSDIKRSQILDVCMAGASVTKNRWIILLSREYCFESNDSIWERRKNLLTEAKLWKKAKAAWSWPSDSSVDC